MYFFRKLHADENGFICGVSYSTKENLANKDAWVYVELEPIQRVKYDPKSLEIGEIVKSVMDNSNGSQAAQQ